MFRIIATTALIAFSATVANAQKIDANGKCHGKDGKMAAASVCAGVKAGSTGDYKLNAAGKCMVATDKVAGKKKGSFAPQEMCASK